MGLTNGLIETAAAHADGLEASQLAAHTNLDPFYTEVWCRAAHAAGVPDESARAP